MSDASSYDEKELLARVAAGDTEAFRQLYEQYRKKVYTLGLHILQSSAEAEDVVQDVFSSVWRHRDKLAEVHYLNAYLNIIGRNAVYSRLRKKANEEAFLAETRKGMSPAASPALDPAEIRDLQFLLHQALSRLPAQQKRAFELSRLEGLKHEEIAVRMGISRETVKKHIMEALRNLKAFLEKRGDLGLLLLFFYTS